MQELFTPNLGLMVWTLLTFAILVTLLARLGWKPLLQSLENREAAVRRAVDEANQARVAAEALRVRLEKELAEGQSRVQALLKEAQVDAGKIREQLVRAATEESQRLTVQTRQQLEEEKTRLAHELRQQAADLSIRIAEKLLRHSVNAQEQQRLVQQFLQDVEKEAKAAR